MNSDRTRHLQTSTTTELDAVPADLIKEILAACDLEASTASEGSSLESN